MTNQGLAADGNRHNPAPSTGVGREPWVMVEVIAILVVIVIAIGVLLWKWLVLQADESGPKSGYIGTGEHMNGLVGKEGVAFTPLRPSGTGLIDERRVNVAADGEFIDKG